jgi:hypothetical protein
LRRRHPDLIVPIVGGKVSDDWNLWAARNPGRAVLAESSLRDTILGLYPDSVPQGTVMRVAGAPARSTPADDARRFLDAPETGEVTRWNVRPWTQETYVLESRRRMAEWVGSRLNPARYRELIARLKLLLAEFEPVN